MGLIGKKILKKRAEAMEKSIPESKAKLECLCVRERKNLRYIKNINLPIKKDFKFAEIHTKTFFSFTLETVLKYGEGSKLRKRRKYICKRKPSSKMVAKAQVNLN